MKHHSPFRLLLSGLVFTPLAVCAAETTSATSWHAQSLVEAIAYMVIFAGIGIILAVVGYKIFDKCTPGDLNKEILEHRNIAAAIVAGAVILGICLIIAAAMLG
jgi:uncharacterized membrane protein YjfL (UPF0719 family)